MININNQIITISKFNKIISIEDNKIILNYKLYKIDILGTNLKIKYLSKDDIEIHGNISKVEFYE